MTKTVYVDHSATTKVRSEVVAVMLDVLQNDFGNPSSIHSYGKRAKRYLDDARENIASVINADKAQIFFTSGGTESNNMVIFGLVRALDDLKIKNKKKHIIASKIEHPSVKEPLEYLEKKGWKISWLNVDKEGFVNIEELKSVITEKTLLVSIIHANNEIGTIQDLKQISSICKTNKVLFHTDAVQSFCKIPIDLSYLDVDFMSFSGHKIYGPKGVGALYVKSPEIFTSLLIGGGQESQIRPGTENVPGIVGFGLAAKLLHSEMEENSKAIRLLQLQLMNGLSKIDRVMLTGVSVENNIFRLPGHVSICVKDIEGENLVLQMDLHGVAASSGSACSSGTMEPSHVLLAIGVPDSYVRGSLRLTLGRDNIFEDVSLIVKSIENVLDKLNKKPILMEKL